jgi:hypothetical protein
MNYKIEGKDFSGVAQVSLNGLEGFKEKELEYIYINHRSNPPSTTFVFKDQSAYRATGFEVGYGGEGPHGFHKAILMFSDKINADFNESGISTLSQNKNWYWYPNKGFTL